MEKKYEFTKETVNVNGVTLHRIQAIKDFGIVKKGDLYEFENKVKTTHGQSEGSKNI